MQFKYKLDQDKTTAWDDMNNLITTKNVAINVTVIFLYGILARLEETFDNIHLDL